MLRKETARLSALSAAAAAALSTPGPTTTRRVDDRCHAVCRGASAVIARRTGVLSTFNAAAPSPGVGGETTLPGGPRSPTFWRLSRFSAASHAQKRCGPVRAMSRVPCSVCMSL